MHRRRESKRANRLKGCHSLLIDFHIKDLAKASVRVLESRHEARLPSKGIGCKNHDVTGHRRVPEQLHRTRIDGFNRDSHIKPAESNALAAAQPKPPKIRG